MMGLYKRFVKMAELVPYAAIAFVARVAAAIPFWRSGQTKIDGEAFFGVKWNVFSIAEKKIFLFENVYGIPAPLAPAMTQAATLAEFFFPLMLLFGVMTRAGALGLLLMTAFIQFYVFPEELLNPDGNWSLHLLWAAPLLLVLARGPGALSVDYLLGAKARRAEAPAAVRA